MTRTPPRPHPGLLLATLMLLGGCKTAAGLFSEPKPQDRLDGYEGSLAKAGVNTEMDWGPKQDHLLARFSALTEEHAKLQRELADEKAKNRNLENQVVSETSAGQREKSQRAQIEAQLELKNQKLREQEAMILSLRIEKAKLEQQTLLSRIDALNQVLQVGAPGTVEAAAPMPGRR
ncbi:MAG: hypothetical protein JNK49_19185 [Planctomycetes bacterium]|nr:hypothetical protein [Planctomycetota bacterium]